MANERRRYYRHPVATPVYIKLGTEDYENVGTTINLSEGGLAAKLPKATNIGMPVRFRFKLPETHNFIEGKGDVAWVANGLTGVKFGVISTESRKDFEEWLQKKMNGPEAIAAHLYQRHHQTLLLAISNQPTLATPEKFGAPARLIADCRVLSAVTFAA